ncbi:hypothetical protein Tco_0775649 [Tanacetum coccineum]
MEYCNRGNLTWSYIVGDSLHYQDYEWYEALKENELKEQALRNKAIMEGLINDDESKEDEYEDLSEKSEDALPRHIPGNLFRTMMERRMDGN